MRRGARAEEPRRESAKAMSKRLVELAGTPVADARKLRAIGAGSVTALSALVDKSEATPNRVVSAAWRSRSGPRVS